MKKYIKLFEEFILEKDPLASLNLDDVDDKEKDPLANMDLEDSDKKDKKKDSIKSLDVKDKNKDKEDDFFKKEKEAIKKKKENIEKKHDNYVNKKLNKIENLLQDYPEINKQLGNKIINAVNSQDRVKIHNVFNDLTALQIKHQENGDEKTISHIAKLKDQIDDLDKSYTDDKMI